MNERVTFSCKCYIFICAGCEKLAESERSDAVTCSTACRVRAHRYGSVKMLRELAESLDVTPATIQQWKAIRLLVPDMAAELISGKRRKFDNEVRQVVRAAFWERLMQAMEVTL